MGERGLDPVLGMEGDQPAGLTAPLLSLIAVVAGGVLAQWAADTPPAGWDRMLPAPPASFATLLLPDLFGAASDVGSALPRLALLPEGLLALQPAYVGLIPLCLALAGLLGRPPRPRLTELGRLLVLLALAVNAFPDQARSLGLGITPRPMLVLGLLAAVVPGVLWSTEREIDGRDRVGARAVAALASLAALVALGVAAIGAGSSTFETALAPLLDRLPELEREAYLAAPELLAASAEHLRAVLDRAAVTAFAASVTLLWFLKRRDALSAWALVVVTAADLGWRAVGAPGLGA